MSFIKLHKANL